MIRITATNKWYFSYEGTTLKSEPALVKTINTQDAPGRSIYISIHDSEEEALAKIEELELKREGE